MDWCDLRTRRFIRCVPVSQIRFIGWTIYTPTGSDADKAREGGHVDEGFNPLHGH
jgi:hypothetical protein